MGEQGLFHARQVMTYSKVLNIQKCSNVIDLGEKEAFPEGERVHGRADCVRVEVIEALYKG
jgi:hypothetical protein